MRPLLNIGVYIIVVTSALATPDDIDSPTRDSLAAAFSKIPSDPDLAFETAGGMSVAFYAMYGSDIRKAVANLPEKERGPKLESMMDMQDIIRTTYIIRTFRVFKLQMSETKLRMLSDYAKNVKKFTTQEALANELYLYATLR